MLWLFHINSFIQCGVFIYDRMLVIRQATQSGDVAACRIYHYPHLSEINLKLTELLQLLIFSAASHASPPVAFYYNMINSGNCLIRAPYLMKKVPCLRNKVGLILK